MREAVGRVVVLVLALAVMLPAPTHAEEPAPGNALGLSTTQEGPWTGALDQTIFTSPALWVPGDVETAGFWARNQSSEPTEMRVKVSATSRQLVKRGDLTLQVRADGGPWGRLSAGTWSTPHALASGDRTYVEIRATLPASSPNASQGLELAFDVKARLTYTGDDDGRLPHTGAAYLRLLLGVAFACLATGLWLTMVARRRDNETDEGELA